MNRERLVAGTLGVAGWLLALAMFLSDDVGSCDAYSARNVCAGPVETIAVADLSRAQMILLLAVVTAVGGWAVGFRIGGRDIRIKESFAEFGALVPGFFAGFVTSMPIRAGVPANLFWVVVATLYVAAFGFIIWYARRA